MARLRQLPQLYLRGSIANETIKHLPPKERQHVHDLTISLASSPLLAGHRQEFLTKLGQTIGGDYRDDITTAEAEFKIAIWRGLVYLLYHTNYTYRCEACGQGSYLTQRGKPKEFDRRFPICPSCSYVRITDPGGSKLRKNQFVHHDKLQATIMAGWSPRAISCIVPMQGERKVVDPQVVLSDPDQVAKFFGEFIWNYFRQHLRENEIRYHSKKPTMVAGSADKMAVEEIMSVLIHAKFPYLYQPGANPHNGYYCIQANLDIADASVIRSILALTTKYKQYRVKITIGGGEIMVKESLSAKTIEAVVVKPQVVSMQTKSFSIGENGTEDTQSVYDLNYDQIAGVHTMPQDGIAEIDSSDLLGAIRTALPDGAKHVLDIITQTGETWERFVITSGAPRGPRAGDLGQAKPADVDPREASIAKFLNVSPRQIKMWKADIRVQCLAHDFVG